MATKRVGIVGGGLAGLVAARHLAADGFDVTLFEREERVGGRVRTLHTEGYTFDRGFQVLFTAYPAARRELDFDDLDLRTFDPGVVLCRSNHRSTLADPLRDPGALVETALNRDISVGDKLRLLDRRYELARKSPEEIFSGPDAPIDDHLVGRGFTQEFVDRFAAPLYGAITMDRSLSTSKRIFEFTFKMLASGDVAVPAEGMEAIPQQLLERAEDAGARVERSTPVTDLDRTGDEVSVALPRESETFDAVVVAADPKNSRELTGVDAIPTEGRGCVTQFFSLPGTELSTGKRLLLNAAGGDVAVPNHVAPMSAVAPEHAPDDELLLSATTLGRRDENDSDLASRTRETLVEWFPEYSLSDLSLVHTERHGFAQFAQPPGFHDDLPDVRAPEGRVYLAGDYTELSAIDGALQSGRKAAAAVKTDLQ